MPDSNHFKFIFWYIVGVTAFGMALTIFVIVAYPKEESSRFADMALMFWLSTAVSGGLGYLIGSSMEKIKRTGKTEGGTTTGEISASFTTEPAEVK